LGEAISAIHDCYLKQKITKEEEYIFIEKLLFSENNFIDRFSINIRGDEELLKTINFILENNSIQQLDKPGLILCDCSNKPNHAYLCSKNGFHSYPLISKRDCVLLLRELLEDNLITEKEFNYLNTVVETLPLIESADLN
jgi:hypothetical protein